MWLLGTLWSGNESSASIYSCNWTKRWEVMVVNVLPQMGHHSGREKLSSGQGKDISLMNSLQLWLSAKTCRRLGQHMSHKTVNRKPLFVLEGSDTLTCWSSMFFNSLGSLKSHESLGHGPIRLEERTKFIHSISKSWQLTHRENPPSERTIKKKVHSLTLTIQGSGIVNIISSFKTSQVPKLYYKETMLQDFIETNRFTRERILSYVPTL